ncbi:ComF family protein [Diplocloster agilis]|uniref:ComF family protein n=1 Tax=Diplocloster agilis TaxID=2850323 RepID=A0A949K618_9FIRM|nr:ComF family protein [Diplocloster agilis]MBU9736618.1 ComF family protein [Diplocloster agilis]
MRWKELLLDFFFPRRCPVCDQIVTPYGEKICKKCRTQFKRIAEPKCKRCGKPLEKETAEYCYDCARKTFHYESGIAAFVYDAGMKNSIARFKYAPFRREYADYYAEEMCKASRIQMRRWKPDALIPVPIHKARLAFRGFNQAELLARGLSKEFQIPVRTDLVYRVKKTTPQKELNDKERKNNLKSAFHVKPNAIECKTVVLVDDIYTTGSTMDALAKALKANGVEQVYFVCLAIGRGY